MSDSSSLKRPHGNDDNTRPFKKLIIDTQYPIFDDLTARTESITTTFESGLYRLRKCIPKSVDIVAVKVAMISKVKNDWSDMPIAAQKGMENFTGAICYRLSLLQALLHQTLFVHFLLDFHRAEHCVTDTATGCIACSLRFLILEYWRESNGRSGTLAVLRGMDTTFKALGWAADVASGQADPEDQLTWIWKILQSQLPSSALCCLQGIMQSTLTTVISCPCGYESRTSGHEELTLAIDIYRALSAKSTLAAYLEKHLVVRLSDYRCDGCHDTELGKDRRQLFARAPAILAVQLKRVVKESEPKLCVDIPIDRFLDLNSYRDPSLKEQLNYELNAVVSHKGHGRSGHYISFAKGPEGGWSRYDDRRMTTSSLAAAISSRDGFTPYLMYYQRK